MYINSYLNYAGSKYKLLNQIVPHFDSTKSNFIDLFAGGGSVFANVVDKYEKVWVNDIIKDLIEIHKNIIFNKDEFVQKVKSLCVSNDDQDGYVKRREEYNNNKTPEGLCMLILSCTNNLMRFNQSFGFNQTFGKRSYNKKTEEKINAFSEHLSKYKDKLHFTDKQFYDIWPKEPNKTFWMLDPPYNGKINNDAGYNCYYKDSDDLKLYDYCQKIQNSGGTFSLSSVFNDDKQYNSLIVNKLLEFGFNKIELDFTYDKVSRNKDKVKMKEIIIKNY